MTAAACLRSERGAALVIALTFVLIVTAIGAAVTLATRTETLLVAGHRQSQEALYAAEGAVALALHDLAAQSDWNAVLTGASPSSFTDGASIAPRTLPGGGTVALCCGPGSMTAEVQLRAHGGRSWGSDTPQWQIFAWGPVDRWLAAGRIRSAVYLAVWVADDPADGDGDPMRDSNDALEVHAHALGPGGGRRIVHVLVARPPGGPTGLRVLFWRDVRW